MTPKTAPKIRPSGTLGGGLRHGRRAARLEPAASLPQADRRSAGDGALPGHRDHHAVAQPAGCGRRSRRGDATAQGRASRPGGPDRGLLRPLRRDAGPSLSRDGGPRRAAARGRNAALPAVQRAGLPRRLAARPRPAPASLLRPLPRLRRLGRRALPEARRGDLRPGLPHRRLPAGRGRADRRQPAQRRGRARLRHACRPSPLGGRDGGSPAQTGLPLEGAA